MPPRIKVRKIFGVYKRTLVSTILIASVSSASSASSSIYIVQSGDVLSIIARKIGKPIYGPRGTLNRLLELNPQITDPHRIYVGNKIYLLPRVISSQKNENIERTSAEEKLIETQNVATIPDPAVPPTQLATESTADEVQHSLGFFGSYGMTTLHAYDSVTDSSANIFSTADQSAGLLWAQDWKAKFGIFAFISGRHVEFASSTNSLKNLVHTSQNLMAFGFGAQHLITQKLKMKYTLSDSNELFVYGASTSTLSIDSAPVIQLAAQASYPLVNMGKTSLSTFGTFGYVSGTTTDSYRIDSGNRFGAGVSLNYGGQNRSLILDAGFSDRRQKTSVATVQETSYFLKLTMWIPFLLEGPVRSNLGE